MHYLIFKLILTSVTVTNYIINSTNFRYMKGESESVSHSIMSNSLRPHGLYLPGSSVHGILQARMLEWIAIPFSRGSSRARDQTRIVGRFFTI